MFFKIKKKKKSFSNKMSCIFNNEPVLVKLMIPSASNLTACSYMEKWLCADATGKGHILTNDIQSAIPFQVIKTDNFGQDYNDPNPHYINDKSPLEYGDSIYLSISGQGSNILGAWEQPQFTSVLKYDQPNVNQKSYTPTWWPQGQWNLSPANISRKGVIGPGEALYIANQFWQNNVSSKNDISPFPVYQWTKKNGDQYVTVDKSENRKTMIQLIPLRSLYLRSISKTPCDQQGSNQCLAQNPLQYAQGTQTFCSNRTDITTDMNLISCTLQTVTPLATQNNNIWGVGPVIPYSPYPQGCNAQGNLEFDPSSQYTFLFNEGSTCCKTVPVNPPAPTPPPINPIPGPSPVNNKVLIYVLIGAIVLFILLLLLSRKQQ